MNDVNQEANLIGKSDTWYETTIFKPKISSHKKKQTKSNLNSIKINKSVNLTKKIKKEKEALNIKGNNNNIDNTNINKTFLKKKRKRKKKIRYTKNSTVFELKRIFDDKDNIKDNDNINNKEEKK